MVVRCGYKQTEVGVFPQDWDDESFDKLFTFANGFSADRTADGKGLPFVNVLEPITYSHLYGPEITGRVSLPDSVAKAYAIRKGDVLFNRTSETEADLGLAATYLGTERVVFGGFVIRGRPTSERLDPKYSGYALRAPALRSQIIRIGQGAIRSNIGQRNLRLVIAPIPQKAEQEAIAAALSDVDALLGGLERLITKKCDLKQAAMQQLLAGQIRLPGEWKVKPGYKQTDVGMIPEDWQRVTVMDLASRKPNSIVGGHFGSDLVSNDYVRHGVPVIRGQNMIGHVVSAEFVFVSPEKTKYLKANTAAPRDIVFTQSGTLGQVALVPENGFDTYVVSQSQMKLTADVQNYDPEYLLQFFISRPGQQQILESAIQTGVPHTNLTILKAYKLAAPPLPEQRAIAAVLSDMDAELRALKARRDKTRALKQAMMHELLTGKSRLVPAGDAHA